MWKIIRSIKKDNTFISIYNYNEYTVELEWIREEDKFKLHSIALTASFSKRKYYFKSIEQLNELLRRRGIPEFPVNFIY